MKVRCILSEALRNITCGTSRAFAWFLAVMAVGALLGGYEAMTVVAQEREASARIAAAADVSTLVSTQAVVDGMACDRLAAMPGGPASSGAMRPGPQLTMLATPGRGVTSFAVTPGLLRVITSDPESASTAASDAVEGSDPAGVWVSDQLAADFGLARGSRFATTDGETTVAGVYAWPNDGRDTRFAYAVLTPASADAAPFHECWARQWPSDAGLDALLLSTLIARTGDIGGAPPAGVTSLNRSFDRRYDANALYAARITRLLPFVAAGVGVLIGAASVWRRRLEYAGALHSGQRKGEQLLGVTVETLIWSGLGAVSGIGVIAAVCWTLAPSGPALVALAAVRAPMMAFAGSLVAALAAAAPIRESQLFRYFKTR